MLLELIISGRKLLYSSKKDPVALIRGKPASTWISCVKKQLNELNVSWEEAKNVANDRKKWNNIISKYCKNIT